MNKRKVVMALVIALCVIVFTVSAVLLVIHFFPVKNDIIVPPSVDTSSEEVILPENPINFAEQQAINEEICAWISVPGANVNYPILQSNVTEENYYLNHDVNKKSSAKGAIYIQRNNTWNFSDPNTVVYGHNMRNGTMFGSLKKFRKADFFNENRYIYVYTPGHILTYEIYSAFVYDDRHILNSFDFSSKEEYAEFLSATLSPKSMTRNVREGIEVDTNDRIITLSTCTGVKTQRYLVVGVLVNDQQTK